MDVRVREHITNPSSYWDIENLGDKAEDFEHNDYLAIRRQDNSE